MHVDESGRAHPCVRRFEAGLLSIRRANRYASPSLAQLAKIVGHERVKIGCVRGVRELADAAAACLHHPCHLVLPDSWPKSSCACASHGMSMSSCSYSRLRNTAVKYIS